MSEKNLDVRIGVWEKGCSSGETFRLRKKKSINLNGAKSTDPLCLSKEVNFRLKNEKCKQEYFVYKFRENKY